MLIAILVLVAVAWVGHACVCTAALNVLYGLPLPKLLLKGWRFATGAVILAFPVVPLNIPNPVDWSSAPNEAGADRLNGATGRALLAYAGVCLAVGGIVFPVITVRRATRKPPRCLAREEFRTVDVWGERGRALVGDGRHRWAARVPGNGSFVFDITDMTLQLPNLPPALDGLTVLLLSDLHFHGTPARDYFERLVDEVLAGPTPDLICLAGDFVDSDTHHEWIGPLLGRLRANEGKFAVLGNHDKYHDPDRVRAELSAAGYTVLGNGWRAVRVRGIECVVVGHEGPWFRPGPDLTAAPSPEGAFRLCVSHTPDNFYWGVRNSIGLMLCGHVHGGGIRVPVVGSIFVPSIYGRRFDCGVFEDGGTAMVVSRGVSGKEPLRIRCNPQVIRVTLAPATPTG